jgi:16S rRNA processing protein RimM
VPGSPKRPEADEDRRVVLGVVLGAYGVQGWLRIKPLGEDRANLLDAPQWGLRLGDIVRELTLEEAKEHGAVVVARLAGIDDREAAEALRGAEVTVPRASLPKAGEGEYYWADLVGLEVRNLEGERLGSVDGLIAAPAHDVLRIARDETGSEQLIPFVEPIVKSVDLAARTITVDWQRDY